MEAVKMSTFHPFEFDAPSATYTDFILLLVCDKKSADCFLNRCQQCDKIDVSFLKNKLKDFYLSKDIVTIEYMSWTTVDRTTLLKIKENTEDFVETFFDKLAKLKPHNFIAKQQSLIYQELKSSLEVGEILVTGDFSQGCLYTKLCTINQKSL